MFTTELTENRDCSLASPLVSILIINWNGKAYIETCLRACLQLTYPNYEIIVLDNNSTDGSREIVECSFPEVQLVKIGENVGFARACNIGIGIARGGYVAILCSDVCVDSMWLTHLVEEISDSRVSSRGRTVVTGGAIYSEQPNGVIWGGSGMIDLVTGSGWQPDAFSKTVKHTEDVDFISGGAMLVQRNVFKRIGVFDEGYFLYFEDADFCTQVRRAGYQLRVAADAKCWHMTPMEQYTARAPSLRAYYLYTRSRFRLYFKNFPLKYLFSALTFQLVIRPIFEVFCFHQSPIYLLLNVRAFKANLIRLREIFVARKQVRILGEIRSRPRPRQLLIVAVDRLTCRKPYRW